MIGPAARRVRNPSCQQQAADEFQNADDPGPQQAVLEADALEEARRALDIAEQYLLAVKRQ